MEKKDGEWSCEEQPLLILMRVDGDRSARPERGDPPEPSKALMIVQLLKSKLLRPGIIHTRVLRTQVLFHNAYGRMKRAGP
jgi:hypothetical protein